MIEWFLHCQIQWTVDDVTNTTDNGIDFGDDIDKIDFGDDAIDFGEDQIALVDTVDISVEAAGTEIDFGIETVDESSAQKLEDVRETNNLGKKMMNFTTIEPYFLFFFMQQLIKESRRIFIFFHRIPLFMNFLTNEHRSLIKNQGETNCLFH